MDKKKVGRREKQTLQISDGLSFNLLKVIFKIVSKFKLANRIKARNLRCPQIFQLYLLTHNSVFRLTNGHLKTLYEKKNFQNTKNEITYNFDMQHETRLSACIHKFITKQRCFVLTNMKPILGQTICFFSFL